MNSDLNDAIAVVGMACQFPKAKNIAQYWQNLVDGVECIETIDDQRYKGKEDQGYVNKFGSIGEPRSFDSALFGFYGADADALSPEHRLVLECSWTALEDAGYVPSNYTGQIGCYIGGAIPTYADTNIAKNPSAQKRLGNFRIWIGNSPHTLATLVSYKFGLKGPAQTISTACSSSLVALHQACQSLLTGECDMTLTGGVNFAEEFGYFYSEGSIYSNDGKCRAFDEKANGTVPGNGCGIVLLKRYADAVRDNDNIYALVRGSAINNDGNDKVAITAPSASGQAEVIREALHIANVPPSAIGYVETHGTGTAIGDPIEFEALTHAYGEESTQCVLGSVKTNMGHLDTAAGIAGFIKTVLILKNGYIPQSLHFNKLNPEISNNALNFSIAEQGKTFTPAQDQLVRFAGVSSFGVGGTNAHVILSETPEESVTPVETSHRNFVLPISAKSDLSLDTAVNDLCDFLEDKVINLENLSYTMAVGRKASDWRVCTVLNESDSTIEIINKIKQAADDKIKIDPFSLDFSYPLVINFEKDLPSFSQSVVWQSAYLSFLSVYTEITGHDTEEEFSSELVNLPVYKYACLYANYQCLIQSGLEIESFLQTKNDVLFGGLINDELTLHEFITYLENDTLPQPSDEELFEVIDPEDVAQLPEKYIELSVYGLTVIEDGAPKDLIQELAVLWQQGADIDFSVFYSVNAGRLSIPTYPFDRKLHWIEAERETEVEESGVKKEIIDSASNAPRESPYGMSVVKHESADDFFTLPTWKLSASAELLGQVELDNDNTAWLIFSDRLGVCEKIVTKLTSHRITPFVVIAGEEYTVNGNHFTIRPAQAQDYTQLLQEVEQQGKQVTNVVHAWSLEHHCGELSQEQLDIGAPSLFALTQALEQRTEKTLVNLSLITNFIFNQSGDAQLSPQKTPLTGICKALPQDYKFMTSQCIDIVVPDNEGKNTILTDMLLRELFAISFDQMICLRGSSRWVMGFERLQLQPRTGVLDVAEQFVIITNKPNEAIVLSQAIHALSENPITVLGPQSLLDEHADFSTLIDKSQGLITFKAVDLVNVNDLHDAVVELEQKHPIKAAFFAYRQPLEHLNFIHTIDIQVAKNLYQERIKVLQSFEQVFAARPQINCIFFSTNVSLLGGIGSAFTFGIYGLQNNFVELCRSNQGLPWVILDEEGMFLEYYLDTPMSDSANPAVMRINEVSEVLNRVMNVKGFYRITATSMDMLAREEWIKRNILQHNRSSANGSVSKKQNLTTLAKIEKRTSKKTSSTIASLYDIVETLTGNRPENDDASLFDLGWDSIVVLEAMSFIREQIEVDVPIRSLLEADSIAELGLIIDGIKNTAFNPKDEVLSILQRIESMDEQSARARLDDISEV